MEYVISNKDRGEPHNDVDSGIVLKNYLPLQLGAIVQSCRQSLMKFVFDCWDVLLVANRSPMWLTILMQEFFTIERGNLAGSAALVEICRV